MNKLKRNENGGLPMGINTLLENILHIDIEFSG